MRLPRGCILTQGERNLDSGACPPPVGSAARSRRVKAGWFATLTQPLPQGRGEFGSEERGELVVEKGGVSPAGGEQAQERFTARGARCKKERQNNLLIAAWKTATRQPVSMGRLSLLDTSPQFFYA
jgi:hypothetical protein